MSRSQVTPVPQRRLTTSRTRMDIWRDDTARCRRAPRRARAPWQTASSRASDQPGRQPALRAVPVARWYAAAADRAASASVSSAPSSTRSGQSRWPPHARHAGPCSTEDLMDALVQDAKYDPEAWPAKYKFALRRKG